MSSELVSVTDIAKMASVDVSTVSNWRRRHADTFPRSVPNPGGKRARFLREEVTTWLTSNQRTLDVGISADEVPDFLRGALTAEAIPAFIGAALCAIKASVSTSAALELMKGGSVDADADLFVAPQLERLAPADVERSLLALAPLDDPAAYYRSILALGYHRLGHAPEHTTPEAVTNLMIALSPDGDGTAFDPCSGHGGLLFAALSADKARSARGVDIDVDSVTVSQRLAYLGGSPAQFSSGDSLTEPVAGGEAELVLCDPPYGALTTALGSRQWPFGTPKATSDLAWPQVAYQHLSPSGTAIVVTSLAPLFERSRSSIDIRNGFVRSGALRAIIALPARLRANTAIPLALWVLNGPARRTGEVALIDASAFDEDGLRAEGPVVAAFQALTSGTGATDPAWAVSIPSIDLLTPEVNLLPSQWTKDPTAYIKPEEFRMRVASALDAAKGLVASGAGFLPQIDVTPIVNHPDMLVLGDLIDSGAVELIRGRSWNASAEGAGPKILNLRHLRDRDAPSDRMAQLASSATTIRRGDVLVSPSASSVASLVWDGDEDWVPGSYVDAFRIHTADIDPYYLAASLRHPRNLKYVVASAVRARIDSRQFRIADIPIDAQHQFAAISRELGAREHVLGRLLDHLSATRATIDEAATSGIVIVSTNPTTDE